MRFSTLTDSNALNRENKYNFDHIFNLNAVFISNKFNQIIFLHLTAFIKKCACYLNKQNFL